MTAPRFERDRPARGPVVQGFAGSAFSVDGQSFRSLLLTPERAIDWEPPALADLALDHLAPILSLDRPPEFLILGTGEAMAFAPRALREALEERGIGLEVMDSKAAARTWGMLRGEDRWIVAAILPLA